MCQTLLFTHATTEGIADKSYLSGRALPSRSASERVSSCAAGKSAASENPSEGLLMKSLTLRGACPLLPVLLMAHELSLTAAAAQDPHGKDLKVQRTWNVNAGYLEIIWPAGTSWEMHPAELSLLAHEYAGQAGVHLDGRVCV